MNNDPNQAEPEAIRIAIDPSVEFNQREVGGRTMVVAHHRSLGKFFQLGPEEYRIACLMDGSRSITEILNQLSRDGIVWEPSELAELASQFISSGIANSVSPSNHKGPNGVSSSGASSERKPFSWTMMLPKTLSMVISQRIPLLSGNPLAARLERRIGSVFSATGMLCWSILVLSGIVIVAAHPQAFAEELRRMFEPGLWVVLFVMWVVAKVIHELGHAVAARHHGVHVGKIGIMFFFLAPLAYVDVTDAWKLKSRWSRIQIALAGVYLELGVAALAAWTWWFLPDGLTRHLAAQLFLVAGPATLLVNANPLLRLDGYYVLADLTEIPNLRMHGRRQLGSSMEKILVGIPAQRPLLMGWRRPFATLHAAASVVFQIVWMGGLIIAASMWVKGLGIALAFAGLMLWAILPLSRWVYRVWNYPSENAIDGHPQRRRLFVLASSLMLGLSYLGAADSPLARRVPVVVQFRDEQIARAATEAFVAQVYATRGQRVKAGMLLIELSNPELQVRRDQKADDWKLAQLRAIQFRRTGELSKSANESDSAASLQRQLEELDQQIASLRVVAVREGLVLGTTIESLEGRFVKEGEELLRVSDPQEKELLASVGERDIEAYQAAARRGATAHVRLRGGTTFTAVPSLLRPRARRSLPHSALAATVGGPLPVEPSPEDNETLRVIEPQMEGITELDPVTSAEIQVGRIGTMTIDDNRTLVVRMIDAVTR